MVAYSFKSQFAGPIIDGTKRQTVRANRNRHARPGEAIQLYSAMRTKHCRKLLDIDPICTDVLPITIDIDDLGGFGATGSPVVSRIWIDGIWLDQDQITEFAMADGFLPDLTDPSADILMAKFWQQNHGYGRFKGVLIQWGTGESWGA